MSPDPCHWRSCCLSQSMLCVCSHAPPLVVLTPEVKLGYMQELTSMNGHVGREATQLLLRICVTGFQKATCGVDDEK